MASRKRPPDRDKDPPKRGPRPFGQSLREPLKALRRALGRKASKEDRASEASRDPAAALSFRHLAADVAPLGPPPSPALPHEPSPATLAPRPLLPQPKLWVERHAERVRARADGLPVRVSTELESGRSVPRRVFDLHRMTAVEACQTLDSEIRRARREGASVVLVVCGRGTHSGVHGPVLPELAIERLSEELAAEVLAFSTAPRQWGGNGALIVRLRLPTRV
jgi:DNA-nicking Smr family endonuclease